MTFFLILAALHVVFIGAIYGRLDGGGITQTSEWVERTLIMFFFVIACAPFADYWALLAYVGVIGIATGHGQYFLPPTVKEISATKERLDPVVALLFGKDPRDNPGATEDDLIAAIQSYGSRKLKMRCVFGMFVTGSLVGLPAAIIALCFGQYVAASIFGLTGVVKAIAYVVSWKINNRTEIAEYVNGALRNVLCLAVIFLTFGG